MSQEKVWQTHKMAAVGRLSRDVAHEFNNLMQGVVGSLELARKLMTRDRTSEAQQFIGRAVALAQKASSLNRRLVLFSQAKPIAPQALSINAVIADVESMLRDSLSRAFELEVELAADLGTAYCDAGQAEIAIVDMVLDARDWMPDGGAISIATRNEERSDDGSVCHASHVARDSICIVVTATVRQNRELRDRPFASGSPVDPTERFDALHIVDHFARMYEGKMTLCADTPHRRATELSLPCCAPAADDSISRTT